MASLIAGPGYKLNPCEAFVFGGAVLLHDSAMTVAAYQGGLDELKATAAWQDAYALASDENEADRVERATVSALRVLHAQKAEALALQGWTFRYMCEGGPPELSFLIINSSHY